MPRKTIEVKPNEPLYGKNSYKYDNIIAFIAVTLAFIFFLYLLDNCKCIKKALEINLRLLYFVSLILLITFL